MISRRELLVACLGASGGVWKTLSLPGRKRLCRPVVSGPLWWFTPAESAAWGASGWLDQLHQQARIGFNLLWLVNTASALTDGKATAALSNLMDVCAKQKVEVILDTGASRKWYAALHLNSELGTCAKNISRIGGLFRGHPAFRGWYIPHEIYTFWDEGAMYIEGLYAGLVERCKKSADLPVSVSPFFILDRDRVFGDLRYSEPGEYEQFWSKLIRKTGIEIIILQDSGEHFSYVTNEMRRPFFAAMSRSCADAKARLWGNVETAEFECASKEEYVRRYGKTNPSVIKGAPWRPVPIGRLREKLYLASEYCEKIVSWGYWDYCRPSLGKPAARWYSDYMAYYDSPDSRL